MLQSLVCLYSTTPLLFKLINKQRSFTFNSRGHSFPFSPDEVPSFFLKVFLHCYFPQPTDGCRCAPLYLLFLLYFLYFTFIYLYLLYCP